MSIGERKHTLKMRLEADLLESRKKECALQEMLKQMAAHKCKLYWLCEAGRDAKFEPDFSGDEYAYILSGVLPEHPDERISRRTYYLRFVSPKPLGAMTIAEEEELLRGELEKAKCVIAKSEAQLGLIDKAFGQCRDLLNEFLDKLFALPGTHERSEPSMLGKAIYEYVLDMVQFENRE